MERLFRIFITEQTDSASARERVCSPGRLFPVSGAFFVLAETVAGSTVTRNIQDCVLPENPFAAVAT